MKTSAHSPSEIPFFNNLYYTAYQVALSITRNEEDAKDATSETMYRYMKHRQTLNPGNHVPWIIRVVSNECYKTFRDSKIRVLYEREYAKERFTLSFCEDIHRIDRLLDAEQLNEAKKEFDRELKQALREASFEQLFIFDMRLKGVPYKEISQRLQDFDDSLSPAKCRSVQFRFIKQLHKKLSHFFGEDDEQNPVLG